MPIIIGLGNPGAKYHGTRHNIGFELIDRLAKSMSIELGPGKGPFYVGKGQHAGRSIYLVKPTTYMNKSGEAVQKVIQWYKEDIHQCLICYDDLDLDVGTIRLRPGGSAGGHNGVKNIIQHLGTKDFPRLRIGIGNDFPRGQQIKHVLSPFSGSERQAVNSALDDALDATLHFVRESINDTMNKFN